jgi:hypothetical protein
MIKNKHIYIFFAFIAFFISLASWWLEYKKDKDEPRYIIQCIAPVNKYKQTKNFKITENNLKNQRDCQALLWRIPAEYQPEIEYLGVKSNPNLTIKLSVNGTFTASGKFIPINNTNKKDAFTSKVVIESSGNDYAGLMLWRLDLDTKTYNAHKVISKINGLQVFDTLGYKQVLDYRRGVYFIADKSNTSSSLNKFYVDCSFGVKKEEISLLTVPHNLLPASNNCRVESQLDERMYAIYDIKFSQLPQIEAITSSVSNTLKQFMIN